jgi:hypothetical protein
VVLICLSHPLNPLSPPLPSPTRSKPWTSRIPPTCHRCEIQKS